MDYFSLRDANRFCEEHRNWISVALKNNALTREQDWSESIAVGRQSFIAEIQQQLSSRAHKRSIVSSNGSTVLKEPAIPYSTVPGREKSDLSRENTCYWR